MKMMISRAAASRVLAGAVRPVEAVDLGARTNLTSVRTMSKALTIDNINPNILKLEYAVRGPLVIRATEIMKELEKVSRNIRTRFDYFTGESK